MVATLETLGAARSLERDDLAAFYENARRVLMRRPEWNTIILISPAGHLVMDTHFPFGTPLPSIVERESFERVMRTGQPVIGPIRLGPISRRYANAIRVPIIRNGRIVYVLTGVLEIAGVQRILSAQQLPAEWVGTIFDSNRTVVARTRGPERFEHTGRPAADPVRRVLTEGTGVSLANDTVLLSRDGRQIPIEDSAAPILVPGGATAGVVLVFHDASARRQAMAEFRLVANAAPVLMWMADADGKYTFFNRPWLDFTGRPVATQLGDGWTAGVHPEDRARCGETARSAVERRQAYEMEYRLQRHDGEYRWMLDRGVPRYQPDGRFVGYIGSCLDITERRQGEEVRRYLAAIVNGSDDAIVSKTLDGLITSWNAGAARMFGYTAEEAVGQPITLIIPPERLDEEADVLAASGAGKASTTSRRFASARMGRVSRSR